MIHLTSAWSRAYEPLAVLTWHKNKVPYAKRWGLKTRYYIHPDAESGDIAWNRCELWLAALSAIPDDDFIWWSGADAFVTRPEVDLTSFLGDWDFGFSIDNMNLGVFSDCFLMRSCWQNREMLRRMLESKLRRRGGNEQDAFTEFLFQGSLIDYVRIKEEKRPEALKRSNVRVRIFKPEDKFCGDPAFIWPKGHFPANQSWTPDHFAMHVGGKPLDFRIAFTSQAMPHCEQWSIVES